MDIKNQKLIDTVFKENGYLPAIVNDTFHAKFMYDEVVELMDLAIEKSKGESKE